MTIREKVMKGLPLSKTERAEYLLLVADNDEIRKYLTQEEIRGDLVNLTNLIDKTVKVIATNKIGKIKGIHTYINGDGVKSIRIHLLGIDNYYKLNELEVLDG